METALRIRMHRAAADTLQQLHRRRPGAIADVAATHLLAAGDPAGAYPLFIQAALRSLRKGDVSVARHICQRALDTQQAAELSMPPQDASRWRRQLFQVLGDTLRQSDRIETAGDAYAQALLAARSEGDGPAQGRAMAGVGLVALACGRVHESMGALEQAMGTLPQGDTLWPEAAIGLATLRFTQGDIGGTAKLVRQLNELGAAGGRAVALDAFWGELLLRRAEGDDQRARQLVDALDAMPADPHAAEAWVRLLRQRGELALQAGDTAATVSICDRIEEVSDRFVLSVGGAISSALRLSVLWQMGERGTAARLARELPERFKVSRVRLLGVWGPVIRVLAATDGAWELAETFADQSWPPDPPYDSESLRLVLLALCTRTGGDAWEYAHLALRRPPGLVVSTNARIEIDAARVLARTADHTSAKRALEHALEHLQKVPHRALIEEARQLLEELGGGR
jgi:tetratricopeptide (TPR) repeat protein